MSNDELKYFRNEPYMTPNNYDISFNTENIPSNIPIENGHNLEKRLQKLMPLSKIIHVDFNPLNLKEDNNVFISSKVNLIFDNGQNKIIKELNLR